MDEVDGVDHMDEHEQAQAWVAAAMRRALEERVVRAVMGYAGYTSAATMETASVSWADIERLRAKVTAEFGRRPRAIWFVDRRAELNEILEEVAVTPVKRFDACGMPGAWIGTLFGVPVREWSSTAATVEERARAPWFVDVPGVWAEMRDGRHQRIG